MKSSVSRASALLQFAARFSIVLLGIVLLHPAYASSLKPADARPLTARTELLAACNSPQFATTLTPAKQAIADSRAIWLSASLIQWPSVAAGSGEAFALYASNAGALEARKGERVLGATKRVALDVKITPPSSALKERWKYLAPGAVLEIKPSDRMTLDALLREQLLIVREDAQGRVIDFTTLQNPGALDELYASAERFNDYGATVKQNRVTFRLWTPTAKQVHLCAFDSPTSPARGVHVLTHDARTGTWTHSLARPRNDLIYTYLVDVWVNGVGYVRNRVTDPYSQSLTADSKRSVAIDLNDATLRPLDWISSRATAQARARVKHAVDMSIYELHVRDFSANDATVSPNARGKYVAFKEKNSRGMQHLAALSKAGLTDVHLLPVFDFATVPESNCVTPSSSGIAASESQQDAIAKVRDRDCFNWGYDPFHFNAPEGSYATNADDGRVRVREFREMVQALNIIGLRVGMDVVYNHMTASGQVEKSVLDRIVPGYYHRLNAEGKVETSTCCDNTATEHRMMEKLMSDSVLLWVKHYRIDSFRFDLMGHQPRAAIVRMQARLKRELKREIQFLGEGWNFGEVENGKRFVQASQLSLNGTGIATFTDRMRDAARGGGYGDDATGLVKNQGYLNGLAYDPNESNAATLVDDAAKKRLVQTADMMRVGLAGSIRDYAMTTFDGSTKRLEQIDYNGQPAGYVSQPSEVVNYVENHDNETLFDFNVYKMPLTATREERARAQVLGIAMTALAQGIPYYHAGVEIMRSKSMDRNSYDSGDWFNRIDWTLRDNGFASGLPRKDDNGEKWPIIAPRLLNEKIKPTQKEIEFVFNATRDLLAIRASSSLFRLRSAEEIKKRMTFFNVGPHQVPTVIAVALNGEGLPGANFKRIVYLINVDKRDHVVDAPQLISQTWSLHPVQAQASAADAAVRERATFDSANQRFAIPARAAAIFVQ